MSNHNPATARRSAPVDALGQDAYADGKNAERTEGCHRSESAEVYAGRLRGKNLSCSGTTPRTDDRGAHFTPGIDFHAGERGVGRRAAHEPGDAGRWLPPGALEWVNQLYLDKPDPPWQLPESIHPNYWGQLALRNCLREAVAGPGTRGGTCHNTAAASPSAASPESGCGVERRPGPGPGLSSGAYRGSRPVKWCLRGVGQPSTAPIGTTRRRSLGGGRSAGVPPGRDVTRRARLIVVLRVGLTGGIGSGKSAVSSRLAAKGAVVVDSDVLAREVVEPGTDGLAEVVAAFGDAVLTPDGSLDRAALGRRVFGDESARRRLEAIVHPRVRARARELEAVAGSDAVVVHDIPLLVETGRADSFDVVVVVDVPVEVAVERLVSQRGMSADEVRSRMAAQASREDRLRIADLVVDNTGTLADLDERVEELWQALLRRAAGPPS